MRRLPRITAGLQKENEEKHPAQVRTNPVRASKFEQRTKAWVPQDQPPQIAAMQMAAVFRARVQETALRLHKAQMSLTEDLETAEGRARMELPFAREDAIQEVKAASLIALSPEMRNSS